MNLAINGIGVLGGFGVGKEALCRALTTVPGPNAEVSVRVPEGELTLPAFTADISRIRDFATSREVRRINRFSKMTSLAGFLALEDAGVLETIDRSRLGLILATGYGAAATTFEFLDSAFEDGDSYVSPMIFSNSVHASAMSNATILLNITGPSLTVNQFGMSVPHAINAAHTWLAEGRADHVLVGGCDEYCEMIGYTYARLYGRDAMGPLAPLAVDQQTAVLGEGASFLLLSRAPGPGCYGYVDQPAIGWLSDGEIELPGDARVLGLDGHRICSRLYREIGMGRACALAPVYGSLPIGPAFDLAACAIAAREGEIELAPMLSDDGVDRLSFDCADLLKLGAEGEYGLMQLRRRAQ